MLAAVEFSWIFGGLFHVYGDESTSDSIVTYALIICPAQAADTIRETLALVKKRYDVNPSARFHCREIYNRQGRARSPWKHLNDEQAHQFAIDLTTSLGGKGLKTIVGSVDRGLIGKKMPSVGSLEGFVISDVKQLVPFAFTAASAQLSMDPEYRSKMKLWVDPDGTLVKWWGTRKQAGRLLSVGELDHDSLSRVNELVPENLHKDEKPHGLEIADLLAYSSARALSKSERQYDFVFKEIFRLIAPVHHPIEIFIEKL